MSFFSFIKLPIGIRTDRWLRSKLFPKAKTTDEAAPEFQPTTAQEGDSVSVIFGTVLKSDANVCWWGDVKTKAVKSKGGKK